MREAFEFSYQNSELDLGSYCLGGDWLLKLATDDDGLTFRLVDAESCGKGVTKPAFDLIQEWIDADTNPRVRRASDVSLIRGAYEAEVIKRAEDREDDRAEWGVQFLTAAE